MSVVTPLLQEVHSKINALVQPSVGFIPLLDTCEILADMRAKDAAEIEALRRDNADLRAKLASITEAVSIMRTAFAGYADTAAKVEAIAIAAETLARIQEKS